MVLDVAGSQILYAMPVWNGSDSLVGKVLTDSGAFTCASSSTLATALAGIPCHQLTWADAATSVGTTSASFCLSATGPCWNNVAGTLKAVTDAAGATDAPVEASVFRTPSGTALELSGAEEAAPTTSLPTVYIDSSVHQFQLKNASNTLTGTTIKPIADPGSDDQFVKYCGTSGDCFRVAVTSAMVGLSSVTNDAQTKAAIVPNTVPAAGKILVGNAGGTAYAPVSMSGDCTLSSAGVAACYKIWECQPGLGDGLNAIASGTYLQSTCKNNTGVTITLSGLQCYTDNSGTSTMNVTNGAGTALLTGAVTCTSSYAAGTQSATVTIVNGDYLKFTFVADGNSKQTTWNAVGARP
jgi:hypothetical protein